MGKIEKHRWIKQRDSFSCVTVAILNLLKWAGVSVTYESGFDYWKQKANQTHDGSHIRDYSAIFSQIPNIKFTRKTRPTLEEIDEVLFNGNTVLLRSAWDENGDIHRHILLITGRTEKSLFLTNTFRGHAWFAKWLVKAWYMEEHQLRSGIYPTAWFFKKKLS